jgi:hypothetical protein
VADRRADRKVSGGPPDLLNACSYFGDVSARKHLIAPGAPLKESIDHGGLAAHVDPAEALKRG